MHLEDILSAVLRMGFIVSIINLEWINFARVYTVVNYDLCFSGGMDIVFSIFQSFSHASASGWCFFTLEDSVYGVMLREVSSTIYRWQGVFIPLEVKTSLILQYTK